MGRHRIPSRMWSGRSCADLRVPLASSSALTGAMAAARLSGVSPGVDGSTLASSSATSASGSGPSVPPGT
eukprot:scaffold298_cov247-Pinguiococcus_pyrenoidosus.AAC.25